MTPAACLHRREDAARQQRDAFARASKGMTRALTQGAFHPHD